MGKNYTTLIFLHAWMTRNVFDNSCRNGVCEFVPLLRCSKRKATSCFLVVVLLLLLLRYSHQMDISIRYIKHIHSESHIHTQRERTFVAMRCEYDDLMRFYFSVLLFSSPKSYKKTIYIFIIILHVDTFDAYRSAMNNGMACYQLNISAVLRAATTTTTMSN